MDFSPNSLLFSLQDTRILIAHAIGLIEPEICSKMNTLLLIHYGDLGSSTGVHICKNRRKMAVFGADEYFDPTGIVGILDAGRLRNG